VVVERRRPATDAATGESFTELTIEVIETSEVPIVTKGVHVREEIVVRKQRSKRETTVHGTVRREEIEIEQSGRPRPTLAHTTSRE
jgi:stress response protein YsnF